MYHIGWLSKRYIWPLFVGTCLVIAVMMGAPLLAWAFGAFLSIRIALDTWNFFSFRNYSLIDSHTKLTRPWESILSEFRGKTNALAFYGLSRESSYELIKNIMEKGYISQSQTNFLCGPIAFLNFLIRHHPSLFVKTLCELYENGSTQSPFFLQSSFWDRYQLFPLISFFDLFFNTARSPQEMLAGVFKNTHNLLGYNHACLFENFKGCTEPKLIKQWLSEAGFESISHILLKNYKNTSEIPSFSRFLMGGVYPEGNREIPLHEHTEGKVAYLTYYNYTRINPAYFMLNLSLGHWQFHYKNTLPERKDIIQILLPGPN